MRVTDESAKQVLDKMEGDAGSTSVARITSGGPMALGKIEGEVVAGIKFPMLKIVYGVGELSTKFNQGDLVLDEQYRLAARGDSLTVIFAHIQTYWKEYVKYGELAPGEKPGMWRTEAEARAAGKTTTWPEKGSGLPPPTASPAGIYTILVAKPDGIECALFGFELAGKLWAPARMFLDKRAHKIVIAEVQKQQGFGLSRRHGGLLAGQFSLSTKTEVNKAKSRTETVPVLKYSGSHSDADVNKIVAAFSFSGGLDASIEDAPSEE